MNYDTTHFTDVPSHLRGVVFSAPPGVMLSRGPSGLRLVVTHAMEAGDVIYESTWWTIPDAPHEFRADVIVDDVVEHLTITCMHSVRYENTRSLDIPGCFMNHSCDPSSYTRDVQETGQEFASRYEQIAIRNLMPGEEITCDYTLFDWDCDGHTFICNCGAPGCYGEIGGFAALPRPTQERLAPHVIYESERMWRLMCQPNGSGPTTG